MRIGSFSLFAICATNALIQRYAEGPFAALALMPGAAGAAFIVAVVVLSARRSAALA